MDQHTGFTRWRPVGRVSLPFTVFLLLLLLASRAVALNPAPTDAHELLIFHQQKRYTLSLTQIGDQTYLPVVELLNILDLPYSESASVGDFRIFSGEQVVELNRDEALARIGRRSVRLPAAVLFDRGRWLVPQEFVSKVLNRVLEPDIRISRSGRRWSTGGLDFIRIDLTARQAGRTTRIVVHLANAGEIKVRSQGSRVVFSLGNAPVEPPGAEVSYQDERIGEISFEETPESAQLVVQLANESIEARVTHIASQNAYLLEAHPRTPAELHAAEGRLPPFLLPREPQSYRWRQITVDPGHGGTDKGALVKEGVYEKDVTLSIARKVRWVLETELGVETVLSRGRDETLSLEDRVLSANRGHSDLFLSIHLGNWNPSTSSKSYVYMAKMPSHQDLQETQVEPGSLMLVPWDQAQAGVLHRSFRLAEILQIVTNRLLNRGDSLEFRHAPLRLLSPLAMPAVLLELGNLNEAGFRKQVLTDQFQNSVAVAVLSALERFRSVDETTMGRKREP